ncbi:MAG: hypothetical protein CME98_24100 [Hyphomonas sp.]|nr:hypothetical protein [Hyphomonas sp.]
MYENQVKFKKTLDRITFEYSSPVQKKDSQLFINHNNIEVWHSDLKNIVHNFDVACRHYIRNTGIADAYGLKEFHYTSMKLQKTLPGEGYHVWHVEHNERYDTLPRVLVWSVYLNDVEEGGETEFLHFSKRVKPKAGRIVIWPAGFPYLHRGNPPLCGEKYLLTSWLTLKPV